MIYVNHIDPELSNNIGYTRLVNMNLLREINGKARCQIFKRCTRRPIKRDGFMMAAQTGVGVSAFPKQLEMENNFLKTITRCLKEIIQKKKPMSF